MFSKRKKKSKNLDLYVYSMKNWVYIKEILKKLYVCLFWYEIKKYNEIWEKVSNIIRKEVNSELVYNKKYLKAENN